MDEDNVINTERILQLVPKIDEEEPANDIPAMLRKTADRLDAGEWADVNGSIFVLHNAEGELFVFAWGNDVPSIRDAHYYLIKAAEVL